MSCGNDLEGDVVIVREILFKIRLLCPHSNVSKYDKGSVP
jgi:hypothetical protein